MEQRAKSRERRAWRKEEGGRSIPTSRDSRSVPMRRGLRSASLEGRKSEVGGQRSEISRTRRAGRGTDALGKNTNDK